MADENGAKRTSWCETDKTKAAEGVIAFAFTDGTVREYSIGTLPSELIQRLAVHGAEQKLRDNFANAKKDGLTVSDVIGACDELWGEFTNGKFTQTREGGGGESVSLLAAGLLRLVAEGKLAPKAMDVSSEANCEKWLRENRDKEQRKAMRSNPSVAAAMAAVSAERKAAVAASAAPVALEI